MLDRVLSGTPRRQARGYCRPRVENLEAREVLSTATLAPISSISVIQGLGYNVSVAVGNGGATNQTYTVTSTNPNIQASAAQGEFLTLNVNHKAFDSSDVFFSGPLTFQLFGNITPKTVSEIESIVASGFYNTANLLFRVAPGFPNATSFIIQGGSINNDGTGNSGQPGTPFPDEYSTQLEFSNTMQLAMANAGPDTNDSQFFITTGIPTFLNFGHAVFGQVVSDPDDVLQKMTEVEVEDNPTTGEDTYPKSPITMNPVTLSTTNPNGVININAALASIGQTSTVTVTAHDPSSNTSFSQSFQVGIVADSQVERPFLEQFPDPTTVVQPATGNPFSTGTVVFQQNVGLNQPDIFQAQGVAPTMGDPLNYVVAGGISGTTFTSTIANAIASVTSTGIVTVTPTAGYTGPIYFLVGVADTTDRTGTGNLSNTGNYNYHWVQLNVSSSATPVALPPSALPVTPTATGKTPVTIQLLGQSSNPTTTTGLTYSIVSSPIHGTLSQFSSSTGTVVYTPPGNYTGLDAFQYVVTDHLANGVTTTSQPATVTITTELANTGQVSVIGDVLVITPVPSGPHKTNHIFVSESSSGVIQVNVNGLIDATQPTASSISQIVVSGTKANDGVTIEPSVDSSIQVTLDGGHGGLNALYAGAGATLEHGWFGRNVLHGGTAATRMIGQQGHVKFKPTKTTHEIYAGVLQTKLTHKGSVPPPKGTFYKFVKGRLVPITN